ncbi:MAG: nucleoside triphosphate pyrophosphohydrolase [Desulfonauticus sp.]|nr:nucleoside triphosphate pyrophosphohydrolase [Desulfonauticus sp.]
MYSGIKELQKIINILLGPNGCPWDREQTPQSLCDYLIEEVFELVDAIHREHLEDIKEELGDVFFLLFFVLKLYEDKFTLDEVLAGVTAKMVGRHPHVFGQTKIDNLEELLKMWEKIKKQEQQAKAHRKSVFDSIPPHLPPLLRAYRINSKAARSGFTWPDNKSQEEKLQEEWQEWLKAKERQDKARMEEEFGDYLFCLTEYARRHQIKPNTALHRANQKFLQRFQKMEELARAKNLNLEELSLKELNILWEQAKRL